MDGRWRRVGGVVGPVVFVTAWAALGARRGDGYSPVHDPISRLAAVGAPTQVPMTAALVTFAAGVGVFGAELRRVLPGPAGVAAMSTAAASLGIAATPLDSALGGAPHAVAAGTAYATLAATQLLAAGSLRRGGRPQAARVATITGAATAACLLASIVAASRVGLWQRAGLTIGHAWLVAAAVAASEPSRLSRRTA